MGVFGAYLAAACVFTYPLILDPGRAVTDLADPLLDAWALAWVAHQLPRDPLHLFDANRFYPESGTLAFHDPMVGLGILVSPVQALGNPILALNAALLFSLALSGYGTYRLVRGQTGSRLAGAVAGSLFAFNPYRLSHLSHLPLQTAGFIPLLYLSLSRYLEEGRLLHLAGVAVFLWFVSASSAYYGVFTWTLLALAIPYEIWRASAFRRPRRILGLTLALGLSAAAYLPLAVPFMRLDRDFGFERPSERLARASARPADYLRSGAHLHQAVGLKEASSEKTLFPGFLALGLGVLGALPLDRRKALYLLIGAFAAWATLGPDHGLYGMLHAWVPGISGLRVPPRMAIYFFFALSVLAGWGAARLLGRLREKKRVWAGSALLLFPLIESFGGPVRYDSAPKTPEVYSWLSAQSHPSPVVELPLPAPDLQEIHRNAIYLFWSTSHFQPLVNGYATLIPPVYAELHRELEGLPDERGLAALRRFGIRYVILHRDLYLRERAAKLEAAFDAAAGLAMVHRTDSETVYQVIGHAPGER
jgi:hypothetical protein